MRHLPIAAAVVALAGASAADAADLSTYSPPVEMPGAAPVLNWQGFYAGLHGGGGWAQSDSTFQSGAPSPADFSLSGPYVGAQIGYNWIANQWLFGLEADASWSGIDGERVTGGPGGTTTQSIDWMSTIRARLGWQWGSLLPYLTGGVAFAGGTRTNNGSGAQKASASHTGWTIGAGVEGQLAGQWTWKAEYKYVDLGDANYNFNTLPVTADARVHTFEIGLNRHF